MSYYTDTSRLSETSDNGVRYGARSARQGMEYAADHLGEARAQTGEAFRNLAHSTEELAQRGMDVVRDRAGQLRERSLQMRDSTTHYIQDEPVKSMLIAAAVGAALMGLVVMLSRNGSSSYSAYRSRH